MFLIRFVIKESFKQCELYSQLVMTTRLFLTSLLFKPFRFLFLAVCISGSGRLMQTWNEFLYSLDFSRILKFDYRMKNYQDFFPSYSLPQLSEFHAVWHFACSFSSQLEELKQHWFLSVQKLIKPRKKSWTTLGLCLAPKNPFLDSNDIHLEALS